MGKSENAAQDCKKWQPQSDPISEPQRQCLSHVLRNLASSLQIALNAVEDRNHAPTTTELNLYLQELPGRVGQMLEAFKRGSFCTLDEASCNYVSKHVECIPAKDRD